MKHSRLAARHTKQANRVSHKRLAGFLFVITIIVFAVCFFVWNVVLKSTWDRESKLVVAVPRSSGAIEVLIVDSQTPSLVKVIIPPNTDLSVSRQLGIWKASSLWKLGLQEKSSGQLLTESLAKSLSFPVDAWAEEPFLLSIEGNMVNSIKSLSTNYKSSLAFKDKVYIGLFSLRLKKANNITVDLAETSYLKQGVLQDGEKGYKVDGNIPVQLSAYFVDNHLAPGGARVALFDHSSRGNSAAEIAEVIHVLGGKVFAIYDKPTQDSDCKVVGKSEALVKKVAHIFSCQDQKVLQELEFDLEIYLGDAFAKRF